MDLINQLAASQQLEIDLHIALAAATSDAERTSIVQQMNDESDARVLLYNQLASTYASDMADLNAEEKAAADELVTLKAMEVRLGKEKNDIADTRNETIKLIQINTYYGKQYEAYAWVMKSVIIIAILYAIARIVESRFGIFISQYVSLFGIIYLLYLF